VLPVIQPPSDGFTPFEKLFLRETFLNLYKKIREPITKFIIIAYFECGYSQDEIAYILGISQPIVVKIIKKEQIVLRKLKSREQL